MNNINFINEKIKETKRSIEHWEGLLKNYPNEEVLTRCLNTRKIELQEFQEVKTQLEAWEVIKKHYDYQDGDRFNCILEGFYMTEPIKGKDLLIIKKALEVNNHDT